MIPLPPPYVCVCLGVGVAEPSLWLSNQGHVFTSLLLPCNKDIQDGARGGGKQRSQCWHSRRSISSVSSGTAVKLLMSPALTAPTLCWTSLHPTRHVITSRDHVTWSLMTNHTLHKLSLSRVLLTQWQNQQSRAVWLVAWRQPIKRSITCQSVPSNLGIRANPRSTNPSQPPKHVQGWMKLIF